MKDKMMIIRRKFHKTNSRFLRIIYAKKYEREIQRYGCEIPLNVQIPTSTVFPHQYYGIFISGWAQLGENCTIFQQVTIGSNTLRDTSNPGAPVVGNNVYIGAGAKLVGGIRIGNNVRIGANCVVFKDVPDNTTVVMHGPLYIVKDNSNNTFISIDNLKEGMEKG